MVKSLMKWNNQFFSSFDIKCDIPLHKIVYVFQLCVNMDRVIFSKSLKYSFDIFTILSFFF